MHDLSAPIPIAFGITELDPGGAERALVQIVTRLDREQWQPHVICLTGEGELVQVLRDRDVPVTCLYGRRWRPFKLISQFANVLREIRPALLQTFLFHANIAGRRAARKAGVPVVLSGIRVAERRSRLRLMLDRRSEHLVDAHICVSQGVADYSINVGKLNPAKIRVIPNGVDYERFANAQPADLSEFGIAVDHKTVLCVGRLDPQKGVMALLDAFATLSKQMPDTHLLFAGEGPLRAKAEAFVRHAGLQNRVHLAGRRADVAELMQAADCLVLASRWEGMPNVVLEAMSAGLPAVTTPVEGVDELIRDKVTGRILKGDDPATLLAGIRETLEDGTPSLAWAKAAQEVVEKDFTWERVASEYDAVFRQAIESKSSDAQAI